MATKIMTAYGNAQLDTAQKKFGTASSLFDGTGDYIDTPDSDDFNIGGGDFTVDFWVKRNAAGAYNALFGQGDATASFASTSLYALFSPDNKLYTGIGYGSKIKSSGASSIAVTNDSAWHHIATVRCGNTLTQYIDGVARSTADITGITANYSSNQFAIGRQGEYAANYFNGWIDEFRFSKGIARWTSDFTPPTGPFTADAYTVLLLHFDGTDGSTSFIDDSEASAPSPFANTKVNVGGAWKQVTDGYVNVGGIWKPISSIHTNIGGAWKQA